VEQLPAAQDLRRRVEVGGIFWCAGISRAAQPFFAALLRCLCPARPIVVVTEGLKAQESFQQDLETWHRLGTIPAQFKPDPRPIADEPNPDKSQIRNPKSEILFYPAWEVLPHEAKLPHADIVSERRNVVKLSSWRGGAKGEGEPSDPHFAERPPLVITTVAALMQRTFPARMIAERTRRLRRGDRIEPLDLVEWLEARLRAGSASEQQSEIALRGGILDLFPLTSPWPVRLEFFGDELESVRHFDPVSQISREQIDSVIVRLPGDRDPQEDPGESA
jgi:transcription-repair coupling factor (superfamily II helicase)